MVDSVAIPVNAHLPRLGGALPALALLGALGAGALAWGAAPVQRLLDPAGYSQARAEALAETAADWAARALDVPPPAAPPEIRFASRREMARMRFGPEFREDQAENVIALYNTEQRVMWLPDGWTGDDPAEMSILVHEMVHHIQQVSAVDFPCLAAREKDAYAVQARWLDEHGLDLFETFELNDLALHFLTTCPM
jgi:hypothetical protein